MGKTISIDALLNRKYQTYDIAPDWISAIGLPERNFRMLVFGHPGNGKTTFVLKLCKELTKHGKVYYNSIEQGEGKSLQDVVSLVDFTDANKNNMKFGDRDSYDEMLEKLNDNRAKFVVIDSLHYMNLTTGQYKQMVAKYPKIAFIIIAWEGSGGKPKGEFAKAIHFMVDVKTHVKNGTAYTQSRFGATKPYHIF